MAISISISRYQALKLLGLVIGCAAKFVSGSLFVFSVYQGAIKETFNYTQTEVEVMSSMLNLGLGFGFVPGMFYDKFGPQWASSMGLLISVPAYMLLWSTTKSVPFYRNNVWLMAIYFFLCGFGSVFTYMVALNTNIINFDKKWTGTVIGVLNSFFAGSPSVFATMYYNLFTDGGADADASHQDFAGFMLMFAISFGVVDILCILFLRVYRETDYVSFEDGDTQPSSIPGSLDDDSVSKNVTIQSASRFDQDQEGDTDIEKSKSVDVKWEHSNITSTGSEMETEDETQVSMSLKEILLNKDYQLLIWAVAFSTCTGLVYVNNVTVISKSMHLNSNDKTLTIIIPIMNAVTSLSVGFFSDSVVKYIPRMAILLFGCLCYAACQVIAMLFADKIAFLKLATVCAGLGIGIVWSIAPTILKESFYVGNLGRNWGIALFVAAVIGFGAQEVFGALYDAETPSGEVYCYGLDCLRGGLAVCLGIASLSAAIALFILIRKCCQRCCRNRVTSRDVY